MIRGAQSRRRCGWVSPFSPGAEYGPGWPGWLRLRYCTHEPLRRGNEQGHTVESSQLCRRWAQGAARGEAGRPCMYTCVCIYIKVPTFIHTYIHTHIHTYTHTYIHTYIHACMHACMHTYVHMRPEERRGPTHYHTETPPVDRLVAAAADRARHDLGRHVPAVLFTCTRRHCTYCRMPRVRTAYARGVCRMPYAPRGSVVGTRAVLRVLAGARGSYS